MLHNILLLIISFSFFSCASIKTIIQSKNKVDAHISSLINGSDLNMSIGIKVMSLKDGRSLYEFNSDKLMIPASNVKLITSAASLHYLGEEHVFETSILKRKDNLMLLGGADPSLSVDVLDSLAMFISSQMEFIDTLYINETLLDSMHYGKGWMWDEGSEKHSAPVSALTLNHNCIDFEYSPNKLGSPAKINLYPNTKYISVTNNSLTVQDTNNFKKLKIERDWRGQTNHYNITGEILSWSKKDTIKKNISEPNLFVGTVFKELLEMHGVNVGTLNGTDNSIYQDTIAIHYSEPLLVHLDDMMHKSENLTSELLIKFIGISDSASGSWDSGIRKVKAFLFDEVAIDTSSLRIADGSGLSRYNLLSTDHIVQLLAYMHKTNDRDNFLMTLPHGGEKDTRLEGRLISAQDGIHAKTGSISGVTCLSGYALSPRHGPLAFSIMINGFVGSLTPYRQFQDQICNWLVQN